MTTGLYDCPGITGGPPLWLFGSRGARASQAKDQTVVEVVQGTSKPVPVSVMEGIRCNLEPTFAGVIERVQGTTEPALVREGIPGTYESLARFDLLEPVHISDVSATVWAPPVVFQGAEIGVFYTNRWVATDDYVTETERDMVVRNECLVRDWFPSAGAGLAPFLSDLVTLLQGHDADGYGTLKPTDDALSTALWLVIEAGSQIGEGLPRSTLCPDEEGGLRIEWLVQEGTEREVRLVVPASDEHPYIYHESGDIYDIEENISVGTLTKWLEWLIGR